MSGEGEVKRRHWVHNPFTSRRFWAAAQPAQLCALTDDLSPLQMPPRHFFYLRLASVQLLHPH